MLLNIFWKNQFTFFMIITCVILCRNYNYRRHFLLKLIASSGIIIVVSQLGLGVWQLDAIDSFNDILINLSIKFIICVLIVIQTYLLFEVSVWESLFSFAIALSLVNFSFALRQLFADASQCIGLSYSKMADVIILLIITIIMLFAVYNIFKGKRALSAAHFENYVLILFSVLLNFAIQIIDIYIYVLKAGEVSDKVNLAFGVQEALFDFVIVYLLYNFVYRGSLYYERNMLQFLTRQRSTQYEMSRELINAVNIKSHDLKKQIRFLRNESEGCVRSDAFNEIDKCVEDYDTMISTTNSTLSIVLSEKSLICKRNNILFTCMADGSGFDQMDELDVYTLFANMLDNAIEAVLQLEEKDRSIVLTIKKKNSFISIHEENCFKGNVFLSEGHLETTKNDRMLHGFGSKSMEMIVSKYDGSINYSTDNNVFQINILIPVH